MKNIAIRLLVSACMVQGISLVTVNSALAQPLLSATSMSQGTSEWVYPGADGKLVYKTTPRGDRIMDFSYAGYMGGGVALPTVAVRKSIAPSGSGDDTQLIQAAIDEVSALPLENGFRGAVLLGPGIFTCSGAINITADGVVLRGSGAGKDGTTIRMTGGHHAAIVIGRQQGRKRDAGGEGAADQGMAGNLSGVLITDSYVPAGATVFSVAPAAGLQVGDEIEIRKPVTADWVSFMQMDNLTRDGKPQTWIRPGTSIVTRRKIRSIDGNRISIDIPLSDNIDAQYTQPGTTVVKAKPLDLVARSGCEALHIQAPAMEMSYQEAPYSALRINGEDCWARELFIEETMNSVAVTGRRITLVKVDITRTVPNLGASKPAEFAPNGSQVLLDRCSSIGDNIWHAATGAEQTGPIVLLNCAFSGNGHIEGHQRWTTGILLDNCDMHEGGIDLKNRGSMGSGHGWGSGWSLAWNCRAKSFVVQQPPGAYNWMIGCTGPNIPTPQPFNSRPPLPVGVSDSPGQDVAPRSLYLAQLQERLGPSALEAIGYGMPK